MEVLRNHLLHQSAKLEYQKLSLFIQCLNCIADKKILLCQNRSKDLDFRFSIDIAQSNMDTSGKHALLSKTKLLQLLFINIEL